MEINDIHLLSGREFEELVYRIFIKMGFRANITQSTGDGGIDIEAYYNGPIFSGKYLVQCKRWKNVVGEPIIRDFYGTVVAAKALKGIIITSSSFSRQAYEFASGKNLELIDLEGLNKLINAVDVLQEKPIYSAGFLSDDEFDSDTYSIFKDRINNDPKNLRLQEIMIGFLSKASLEVKNQVTANELLNELEARLDNYFNLLGARRTNEAKTRRWAAKWIKAMVKFAQGDMVTTYDLIVEMKLISFNWDAWRKGYFNISDSNYRFQYILFHLLGIEESEKNLLKRINSWGSMGNKPNPNDITYYEIAQQDIINHSKGLLSTEDYLVGWPLGFEIEPVNKRIIVDISNISVGELMNRFLPEGIPDIDKQRKIIESSEGY